MVSSVADSTLSRARLLTRSSGTPREALDPRVAGRAAFGDAAVELARKLRKASPVFSWDTARAPGPKEGSY